VIKTNNNQRYATNAETGFLLRELARKGGVPVQVNHS
jgi:aspartyl aminopeptidase